MSWAGQRDDWVRGLEDEGWWSRVSPPHLSAWAPDGAPLRLVEPTTAKKTRRRGAVKALACYGLLARWALPAGDGQTSVGRSDGHPVTSGQDAMGLRFVDGRPVSAVTTPFLDWCCTRVAARGRRVLALIWDNAS